MPVSRVQNQNQISENAQPIQVRYKNWRGEVAVRSILPQRIYWGATEWHTQEQWLLEVLDVAGNVKRVFAVADIQEWFVQ
jgi:hypothetical protein